MTNCLLNSRISVKCTQYRTPATTANRPGAWSTCRRQVNMTDGTPVRRYAVARNGMACARPTRNYPEGRTGTWAGVRAHQRADEPPCEGCKAAATDSSRMYKRAERERNRDHYRTRNYWAQHHLTFADYEAMLAAQGGVCAICGTDGPRGKDGRRFHIDHDHSCCPRGKSCEKCRRSLLCANCNIGLGALGDDPERLMAAASYLISHGKGAAV